MVEDYRAPVLLEGMWQIFNISVKYEIPMTGTISGKNVLSAAHHQGAIKNVLDSLLRWRFFVLFWNTIYNL